MQQCFLRIKQEKQELTEAFVTELFEGKNGQADNYRESCSKELGPDEMFVKDWVRQMYGETVFKIPVSIAVLCILVYVTAQSFKGKKKIQSDLLIKKTCFVEYKTWNLVKYEQN